MVSFQDMKCDRKAAVYPQLVAYVKKLILLGRVAHYEELPSRRELALLLSINPNTVQKAYKLLEDEGYIRTISNVKSVVIVTEENKESIRQAYIQEHVKTFIDECQSAGMSFQDVISLLTTYWDC